MAPENPHIIFFKEITSTNDYARKLLASEKPEGGTVIQAGHQTAGKGHDGNSWESEAGRNILLSMIIYPGELEISRQFYLSMAAALGIADFLRDIIPDRKILIKWPNDIYVEDKKIGGILINNEIMGEHFEHAIVGIGLNVNQVKFSDDIPNPTSLSILTNKSHQIADLTIMLCGHLNSRFDQLTEGAFEGLEGDYLQNLLGLREWRTYIHNNRKIRAMITGVNAFGHLLLDAGDRKIECDLKEIAYLF
ncbi:MAG TPA: biotin--[acetyl-CoA-carboxylase] ligase [Bacteroidales bacterium]|nr:biotin--[acetyl-CoA-carboxylase] ligase [Bacteroidales bacterium]